MLGSEVLNTECCGSYRVVLEFRVMLMMLLLLLGGQAIQAISLGDGDRTMTVVCVGGAVSFLDGAARVDSGV